MKCKVVHETGGSLRVKILGRQLSYKEYEALHGLLEKTKGVQRIRTYWATGSIALNFRGDRERLAAALRGGVWAWAGVHAQTYAHGPARSSR